MPRHSCSLVHLGYVSRTAAASVVGKRVFTRFIGDFSTAAAVPRTPAASDVLVSHVMGFVSYLP